VEVEGNLIFHGLKRDFNVNYKNEVRNSYKKKFKNAAYKIKEALSVP